MYYIRFMDQRHLCCVFCYTFPNDSYRRYTYHYTVKRKPSKGIPSSQLGESGRDICDKGDQTMFVNVKTSTSGGGLYQKLENENV